MTTFNLTRENIVLLAKFLDRTARYGPVERFFRRITGRPTWRVAAGDTITINDGKLIIEVSSSGGPE